MVVRLEGEAAAELRRLAAAAYPDEGCGVLVGTLSHGSAEIGVLEVTSGRNLRSDRARDRFELDPGDIVAAERSARQRGLDVVGFWHSHPDHPARPSQVDTGRAWPEYAYIIVATTATGAEDVRAWILDEAGAFAEQPVRGDVQAGAGGSAT